MSIVTKLAELESRRDAVLREMDDNATQLGNYVKTQYSPGNVLRRHIGPAIGIAATLGTLAAGAKIPRNGLLRMLWTRLLHPRHTSPKSAETPGPSGSVTSVDAARDGSSADADSRQPRHHPLMDAAPILTNLLVNVAQVIPWRNLMGRVLERRNKHANGSDHADSSKE